MLSGQVLNSDAQLNNFIIIDSKSFIPGEEFVLVFRLYNEELDLRYVPVTTAAITVSFNKTDGTALEKSSTVLDSGDRSIQKVEISEAESEELLGGNFSFEVDVLNDGTRIEKGFIQTGLSKILTGGC